MTKRYLVVPSRRRRSGVVALEYLMVLGVGLIISVPMFWMFVSALHGLYAFFSLVVRGNFL